MRAPPPCMKRYAISLVTFQRGAGRRLQRVQNASAHLTSLVVVQVAAVEVGRSATSDEDTTALHAKVCNQSRNVPAGRWKKAPEVQNASAHGGCLVIVEVACSEVSRSRDGNPTALHAKVCNQSRNVPAGRWKKAPEGPKMRAPTDCASKEATVRAGGKERTLWIRASTHLLLRVKTGSPRAREKASTAEGSRSSTSERSQSCRP